MFEELKIGWRHFLKTWPQLCLRARWYGFVALSAILYWGGVFSLSLIFKNSAMAFIFFVFGLGIFILIYRLLKRQIFSILDASYLSVLAELMLHEKVPFTRFQVRFSRKRVTQKFGNRERIHDAYLRLHKSLNEILVASPFLLGTGAWLGGRPSGIHMRRIISLKWLGGLFLNLEYMDDLLISHCFIKKDDILWGNLRESLILGMQNFRKIFKISFHVSVLTVCLSLAFFMVLIPPLIGLAWFAPFFKFYFFVSALILTWVFRKIFLDSYAMATLVSEFRRIVEGQSPDPRWDKRLSTISGSFFEIKKRACYWERAQRQFINTRSVGLSTVVISQTPFG